LKRSGLVVLALYILLALAVGLGAYNLWSTLTFSVLPPGDLAPFGLMGLRAFSKGSLNALGYGVSSLLPVVLCVFGVGEFHAFGVVSAVLFALTILSVAYASLTITGSHSAMFTAGFLAAFLPLLSQPVLTGDYPMLAAVAFTSLAFSSSISFCIQPRRNLQALLLLSCILALLADGSAFTILICPFILLAIVSWKVQDADRLRGFLSALILTMGLGVFLLPFNVGGYAGMIRNSLVASGLHLIQVILILLGLVAAAGLASLYLASKRAAVSLLGWLIPSIILTCMGFAYYIVYAVPILLVASSHLVTRLLGMIRLVRQAGEFILELKLERLAAAFILVLLVSAEIFYYPSTLQAYYTGNILGGEEVASIKIAGEKLQELVAEGQLLAAPPRVAAWLGAFSGLNVVAPVTADDRWELDAFTSTAFRIMNPYMMVDEWQPFSSRRSPFIYAYDGRIYAFILHVDDGTNAMNVVESNITWHEDMHGLKLVNYSWIETSRDITLVLQLWKRGFNVTKIISLFKEEAELSISYHVVPNNGVKLVNITLPVYIEGKQKILSVQGEDWIQLDMPHVKVKFTYEGAFSQPILVYSRVQDYVTAVFTARNNVINARLRITLLNPKRSPESTRYTSFFDVIEKRPVSYMMTYAASEELFFLEDALERPVEALEVIDSFNRVLFNHEGVNYVEAPSDAEVLIESINGQNRTVTYKTAGLMIHKKINVTQDAVGLRFEVTPLKSQTRLISMTVSIWLPWARTVFLQENVSGGLRLVTDAGNFTIKAVKGDVTFFGLGPDPEFKQPRVQIRFSLSPAGDAVVVAIASEGQVQVEYVPSSRPMMNGSDRLRIRSLYMGLFRCIYKDQTFALYGIVPP
jgi:hypothetical protein